MVDAGLCRLRPCPGRPAGRPWRLAGALAVRSANAGVVELLGHRPVQRQYLHRLGDKGAIVVYVEAETGQVRGFIYSTRGGDDAFIRKMRGRRRQVWRIPHAADKVISSALYDPQRVRPPGPVQQAMASDGGLSAAPMNIQPPRRKSREA